MSLSKLLAEKTIIICTGAGGVGKTTVSASLALSAALSGRKTLVCTIDPAKRLADSLGLKELGNKEARIAQELLESAGAKEGGELWAMMLDSKRTFDDLIERIAPTPESRDRIMANRYYQTLTDALAGSQEFSAMEKLYDLWQSNRYDLIVLDTPPTRHALDFLDAPKRMTTFLDGSVIQWFVKPYMAAGRLGFKFVQRSAGLLFKILEKGTGYDAMADLAEFFLAFDGMYDGFKQRAAKVHELMGQEITSFVLVTSPQAPALSEAKYFAERLQEDKMPLGAVVFNRLHQSPTKLSTEEIAAIGAKGLSKVGKYAPVFDALVENLKTFVALAEADNEAIREFLSSLSLEPKHVTVPFFDHDVHDLTGLAEVAERLVRK
jgi:anion-transporting  ArsA/GET3 family ATPase